MKKTWLFFLITIFAVGLKAENVRYSVATISLLRCQEHAQRIERDFKVNTAVRAAVVASALTVAGYGTYRLFSQESPISLPSSTMRTIKPLEHDDYLDDLVVQQKRAKMMGRLQRIHASSLRKMWWSIKDTSIAFLKNLINPVGIGIIWTMIGKYVQAASKGLDSLVASVFHDKTFAWFVASQTALQCLIEETERHLDHLELGLEGMGSAFALHAQRKSFVDTWAVTVGQLEKVCGFLLYQAQQRPDLSVGYKGMVDVIQEGVYQWSLALHAALETKQCAGLRAAWQDLQAVYGEVAIGCSFIEK